FFFSRRRQHTSFSRDWSSDVCSSDLLPLPISSGSLWVPPYPGIRPRETSGSPILAVEDATLKWQAKASSSPPPSAKPLIAATTRSEERRAGKGGKDRGAPERGNHDQQ